MLIVKKHQDLSDAENIQYQKHTDSFFKEWLQVHAWEGWLDKLYSYGGKWENWTSFYA